MTTVFPARPFGRFIEIQSNLRRKKLHRANQGSNFLRRSFSNRDNLRAPIQFRRERQTQHRKRWLFLKSRPIHFHINSTKVIRPVKQNQLSFFSIETNNSFTIPVNSFCRSVVFDRNFLMLLRSLEKQYYNLELK